MKKQWIIKKKEKSIKKVSLNGYINDPDKVNPTNVRKTPGGEIILKLGKEDAYMINITACQGRWFKVDKIFLDIIIPYQKQTIIKDFFVFYYCLLLFSQKNNNFAKKMNYFKVKKKYN